MYIEKHQNAAGCKITVTATSTLLFDLINTAASTTLVNAGFSSRVNAINLTVEDGDIRVLFDGNTPTATNGILLSSGNVYYYRGVPLDKMKLIRVSGNVVCSVEVGHSDASESTSASAFDVKLEAGDIEIGAVELKNATDDGRAIIDDANTVRAATDNVLLVQALNATGGVLGTAPMPITFSTTVAKANATGAGAINTTTAVAGEFRLVQVVCHFSAAPTTSENFVVKLDSSLGAAYDTALFTQNPSLSAATDLVFTPDSNTYYFTGDEIVVTFTNTDARTYGLTIYYETI